MMMKPVPCIRDIPTIRQAPTRDTKDGRSMEREIYDEDHEAFRDVVKEFVKRYATEEKRKQWEADGEIDRATMRRRRGRHHRPEPRGVRRRRHAAGLPLPLDRARGGHRRGQGSLAGAFGIQDDLAVPYIVHMGTQEQKEKWLPAWRPARSSARSR
jgi:long-chain-acyl-CoA dehydrogenase